MFADLQQLLLVFFILLFSTSTTDSAKLQEVLSSFTGTRYMQEASGDKVIELDHKDKGKNDTDIIGDDESISKSNSEKKIDLLQKELDKQQLAQNLKKAQILENELKNKLDKDDEKGSKEFDKQVEVTATAEGVLMRFKDGVIFEPGGIEVKAEAQKLLSTLGETLDKEQKIRIEGHTDDIPTNSSVHKTNWELSTARAISVMNYLTSKEFIAPQNCSVEGFSEFRPLVENNSDENRAKNRRVDIILLNK